MTMNALSFLQDVAGYTQAQTAVSDRKVKLATIDPAYDPDDFLTGTLPKVTFDGEATLSGKTYPCMAPYWPHPSDRVLMVPFVVGAATKYVIIGTLDATAYAYLAGGIEVGPVSRGEEPAYLFKETVTFTASGSFVKANYPGIRALRVRVQGPGGGGSGAESTSAGRTSLGSGGNSGEYVEGFLLESALSSSETVTVGTGGAGGSGDAGSNGSGPSSFGSHASAAAGSGGIRQNGDGARVTATNSPNTGGTVPTGGFSVAGRPGAPGIAVGSNVSSRVIGGNGASSPLGTGGDGARGSNGNNAVGYGSGGGGASNQESVGTNRDGGDGTDGAVIVEVYV